MKTLQYAFCAFFSVLCSIQLHGSQVQWDRHELWLETPGLTVTKGYLLLWGTNIPISIENISWPVIVWAGSEDHLDLDSMAVVAEYGDVVSAEYFEQRGSYFYSDFNSVDCTAATDYPLVFEEGSSLFIAIAHRNGAYQDRVHYGWMELAIDDDRNIEILASAYNLDFDPITIKYRDDATPEPGVAALFFLGFAALALRRLPLST